MTCPRHKYAPRHTNSGKLTAPPAYASPCFECAVIYEMAQLRDLIGHARKSAHAAYDAAQCSLYVANQRR